MAERREYKGAAQPTTLSGNISSGALSISIAGTSNWPSGNPGPFIVVIDQGLSTEEKIKCTSRSGNTITVDAAGRGFDGTTAVGHSINAAIKPILGATDIDMVNQHAADTTLDDHTQYMHNSNARNVSANHNFTANPIFSGAPNFTGNPTFGGNPVFSATPHFTGTPTFDNMGSNFDIQLVGVGANAGGASGKPARADHFHGVDVVGLRNALLPVGMIAPTAATTAPAGWLICDGSAVSRTTYSLLWGAIGTTYGSGDGTTTFNLPNLVGKVIVGVGDGGHPTVGGTGGSTTQSLSSGNMPAHTHDMTHNHSITDNGHIHGPSGSGGPTGFVFAPGGAQQNSLGAATAGGGFNQAAGVSFTGIDSATTGISVNAISASTGSQGSGSAFSIEQPWLSLNYMIRAV